MLDAGGGGDGRPWLTCEEMRIPHTWTPWETPYPPVRVRRCLVCPCSEIVASNGFTTGLMPYRGDD